MFSDCFEKYLMENNINKDQIKNFLACTRAIAREEKAFLEVIAVETSTYLNSAHAGKYDNLGFPRDTIIKSLKTLEQFLNDYLQTHNLVSVKPKLSTWLKNKFKYIVLNDITPLKTKDVLCFYYASPNALGDYSVLNLMDSAGTLYRFEFEYNPLKTQIINFCENAPTATWHKIDLEDGHLFFVKTGYAQKVSAMFTALSNLSIFFIWQGAQMLKHILNLN